MKKQDLEKGWILETRNGGMFVNAGVQWLGRDGWLSPNNFNDDLSHIRSVELSIYEFDIIKVYKLNPVLHQGFNFASNNKTHLELIWERKEYEYEEISFRQAVINAGGNCYVNVKGEFYSVGILYYSSGRKEMCLTLDIFDDKEQLTYKEFAKEFDKFYKKVNK